MSCDVKPVAGSGPFVKDMVPTLADDLVRLLPTNDGTRLQLATIHEHSAKEEDNRLSYLKWKINQLGILMFTVIQFAPLRDEVSKLVGPLFPAILVKWLNHGPLT
jgi:hypothetical protein